MVTFKLIEKTDSLITYHYYPEGKESEGFGTIYIDVPRQKIEVGKLAKGDSKRIIPAEELNEMRESVNRAYLQNGEEPLTEEEWPTATEAEVIIKYADHAMDEIWEAYEKGTLLDSGTAMWY